MAARTLRVGPLEDEDGRADEAGQQVIYKGTEWYQGKRAQPRRVGKRRA